MPIPREFDAARLRAARDFPYLAAALWSLIPVEVPGLDTLAVDVSWRLYYDPVVFQRWTAPQLAAVLAQHELHHLLREHPARAHNIGVAPETQQAWNLGTDAEINQDALRDGADLPDMPVTPHGLGLPPGKFAEEYYALLKSRPQGTDPRNGKATRDRSSSSQAPGTGGDCGSCADGQPRPYELPPPSPSGADGLSKTEGELLRREVARRILEHSTSRGAVPAGWRRWAKEKLSPKVDWRRELAGAIRQTLADAAGAVNYTYSRPSRRQAASPGVVLPALRRPVPQVACYIDSSGSMNDRQTGQAVVEVGGVLKALGQRDGVHVGVVDAAVHVARRVFSTRQIELLGGGGTDMRLCFNHAAQLRPRPQVIIILSDCESPWPETPPRGMNTVIARLGSGAAPAWARVVDVKE